MTSPERLIKNRMEGKGKEGEDRGRSDSVRLNKSNTGVITNDYK